MVTRANGSGGDCAPGSTPTKEFEPGQMVRRRAVPPKSLVDALVSAPEAFVVDAKAKVWTVGGLRITYRLVCGEGKFWDSGANYQLIDPPAPSGFVTVPPPAPVDGDAERLKAVHATMDAAAPADPHHIPSLDEVADALADKYRESQERDAAAPPAAVHAAAPGEWRARGQAGVESVDGRFQIVLKGNLYTVADTWTGESGGVYSLLHNAQSWCSKREVLEPLMWARKGSALAADRNAAGDKAQFEILGEPGEKFTGVDLRFDASTLMRYSRQFKTRELAQRWCEVRACCDVLPDGRLRYRSPLPF